jgi:hypothetical protein
MNDYNMDHYRFKRNTGLKKSDFKEDKIDHSGSWLVLGVVYAILIILIVGATL